MPNIKRLPTAQVDLARRVVGLLNLYRLLIPPALLGIQWITQPTPSVGGAYPTLFLAVCALYLAAGVVFVLAQRYRGLSLRQLTLAQSIVDSTAIALLLYSSGGVASGIGILLVLTVGAAALLAEDRDAFLMAAIASLAVLVQQIAGQAAGSASENDYPSAGVLGTIIFLVALGAWVLARRLRDSEALVRRQEIDLENLAQLSQYVVQHLRESILVIDSDDRIRLINEPAAHMLSDDSAFPGAHVGDASPRLQQLLNLWRSDRRPGAHSAGTLVADEGVVLLLGQLDGEAVERGRPPVDRCACPDVVEQAVLGGQHPCRHLVGRNGAPVAGGAGTAVVTVTNAAGGAASTLNFGSVSQTLASLTIGAGAKVTFSSGLVGPGGGGESFASPKGALVPEPSTSGLLILGALGALRRRRPV